MEPGKQELVVLRTLDAPRELVFEAWTKPEHLIRWYGPKGFTNTFIETDIRTGGVWKYIMHGPDGVDYPNEIRYTEVVKPSFLAYEHGSWDANDPANFKVTITLEEAGEKTKLTMRMIFQSAEMRDKVVSEVHAIEGAEQTMNKLEEQVMRMLDPDELVITRTVNAPRALVFKAFTEKEHMANWWGPKGMTIAKSSLDLRPGGMYHYCMTAPNGAEMWGRMVYRDIVAPERLVAVVSFSNEKGEIVPAPMISGWPLEVLNIIRFTEANGKTTITITGGPLNASEQEAALYRSMHQNMQEGFAGTFDNLEEYLTRISKA